MAAEAGSGTAEEMSLKDKGNEFFKAGNYLKAAALYTQAIKQDPSNPTLYRYNGCSINQNAIFIWYLNNSLQCSKWVFDLFAVDIVLILIFC